MLADEFDAGTGREALDLAEALVLDEVRAHVLITNGTGRVMTGDPEGIADIRRGLEIALAGNFLFAAIRGYSNIAHVSQGTNGDLHEGLRFALEAEKVAQRLGTKAGLRWTSGALTGFWFEMGDWDRCARTADEFLAESAALGPHYYDSYVRCARAWMRLARGDAEGALSDQAELLISARQAKDPQTLYPALGVSAYLLADAGRAGEGRRILAELFATGTADLGTLFVSFTDCLLAAEILGCRDEARRWLGAQPSSPWFAAARALADQEFVRAADSLDSMGAARSAALARLRAAQELIAEGRQAEADDQLQQALSFFRSVGATRFIRDGEGLLAASA